MGVYLVNIGILIDIKSSKYQSKCKYWMWPNNSKYTDDSMPDPQKYLIGFYYSNKAVFISYKGICILIPTA
jgi:hypothetical protein